MSDRDVSHSLRAYRDRIAGELEEARRAAKEAAERAARAAVLERELAETEVLLGKMGGAAPRRLPQLDTARIASPCKARWDDMVGDEHVRFCGQCEKNVYDLSSLPRDEAEALLAAREGDACVRLFQRADGSVLTADCPAGAQRRRRRRAAFGAIGAGLMTVAGALGLGAQGGTAQSPLPPANAAPPRHGSGLPEAPSHPTVDPHDAREVMGKWAF